MNIELKLAWFTIWVIALTLASCVAAGFLLGYPQALAAFALLGFLGFSPVIAKTSPDASECDERDLSVAKRASLIGGMSSYLAVVLGGMILWLVHFFGGKEMISVHWLPGLVTLAAIILLLVRSLVIVSQYSSRALGSDE